MTALGMPTPAGALAASRAFRRQLTAAGLRRYLFLIVALSASSLLFVDRDVANSARRISPRPPTPSPSPPLSPRDVIADRPEPFPVDTEDYMLEHAAWLRREADRMERRRRRWGGAAAPAPGDGGVATVDPKRRLRGDAGAGRAVRRRLNATLEPPPPLLPVHFATYASGGPWNLTMVRLVRQARRSGWFESVRGYGPSDLPPDFVSQYSDVMSEERGAGYWLWRYPLLELVLGDVPEFEYVFFMDAGAELNKAGRAKLGHYLQRLERHPTKEMVRFPVGGQEASWTTRRVFDAFNATLEQWEADRNSTGGKRKKGVWIGNTYQVMGGLWIFRNGPAMRRFLAFVYDALRPDPAIVTDRYSRRPHWVRGDNNKTFLFNEHRHDQSVSSVAAKVLDNYVMGERGDLSPRLGPEPFLLSRLKNLTWEDIEEREREEAAEAMTW